MFCQDIWRGPESEYILRGFWFACNHHEGNLRMSLQRIQHDPNTTKPRNPFMDIFAGLLERDWSNSWGPVPIQLEAGGTLLKAE